MAETTFISDFKRTFLTGLAALFPVLITLFLLIWLYGLLDRTIGTWVNAGCKTVVASNPMLFETVYPSAPREVVTDFAQRRAYVEERFTKAVGVSIGILGAVVFVYLIGFFLRSYIGTRILGAVDRFFERFPVIKTVYPHARQVADILFGAQRRPRFKHVVAVQYPRRGIYTVGFLTGDGLRDLAQSTGQDFVTVFIPTSPTPLTGFVIIVPRHEVRSLNMSVEDAFLLCMTAGMVTAERQRPLPSDQAVPNKGTHTSLGNPLKNPVLSGSKSQPTATQ